MLKVRSVNHEQAPLIRRLKTSDNKGLYSISISNPAVWIQQDPYTMIIFPERSEPGTFKKDYRMLLSYDLF